MAVPRLRPQEAFAGAVATVWHAEPADRGFRAPHAAAGLERTPARGAPGPRAHRPRAVAGSTDQEVALPIHEFVTRYRRDVEMIMAATLDASAGLTGPEVVAQLESAIDDLAARFDAGVEMSRVISTRRGPTTIEDYVATRIVELVIHTDDLNRSLPEVAPAELHRSALSGAPVPSPASWRDSIPAAP